MSDAMMKKSERGTYDFRCDGTVYVVKWHDSAQVSLASNCQTHLPEQTANRRIGRELKKIPQPNLITLITKYNRGMGGVDLYDQLLGAYRPSIRGKKWWWPLFINVLNISVVAAWKIYRHSHPASQLSHLDLEDLL